jgi:urease accessory protein
VPRAQKILARGRLGGGLSKDASGGSQAGDIADMLLLKYDDRCRQQGFVFGGKGTCIEFDFQEPPRLRTDDLLVLDDGRLAEVVADIEPVIEVRAKDFAAVARLILALGNRHVPVQILANRIRLQKRPEVEALVVEHGLKATELAAPFEPDEAGHHGHGHDHGHGDGHGHHHHHGHDRGHHDDDGRVEHHHHPHHQK